MASSTQLSTNNRRSATSQGLNPSNRSAGALIEPSGAPSRSNESNDSPIALPNDSNNILRAILDELLGNLVEGTEAAGGTLTTSQKAAWKRLEKFKETYFEGERFIDIEALPEASRSEAADPESNLHSSIQLLNLSTLLHLILVSAPDPSTKTRPSGGAEKLKQAVGQLMKKLVVSDSEDSESLLKLVMDLRRQAYLSAGTDERESFSEPLASQLPSSSTRLPSHSLKNKFKRLQEESIKSVEDVGGDRETLETEWKWNDVVAKCKAWIKEEADGHSRSLIQQAGDILEDVQDGNAQEEDDEEDSLLPGEGETKTSSIGSEDEGEEEDQSGENGTQSSRSEQNARSQQDGEESSVSERSTRSARSANADTRASPGGRSDQENKGDEEEEVEDEDDDDLDTGGMYHDYFSNSQDQTEQTHDSFFEPANQNQLSRQGGSGIEATPTTTGPRGRTGLAPENLTEIESSRTLPRQARNGITLSREGMSRTTKEKKPSLLDRQPDAQKINFESQSQSQTQVQPRRVSTQVSDSGDSRTRSHSMGSRGSSESRPLKPKKRQKTNDSSSDAHSAADSRRESSSEPPPRKSRSRSPLPRQYNSYDQHDFGGGGSQEGQLPNYHDRSSSPAFVSAPGSTRRTDPQPFASTSRAQPLSSATRASTGKQSSRKRSKPDQTDSDHSKNESATHGGKVVKMRKGKEKATRKAKVPPRPRKEVVTSSSSSSSSSSEEEGTMEDEPGEERKRKKRVEEKQKAEQRARRERAEDPGAISTRNEGAGNLYYQGRNGPGGKIPWTSEEERLLIHLVEEHGQDWKKMIALHGKKGTASRVLQNRNNVSLKDKAVNIKKKLLQSGQPIPRGLDTSVRVPPSKLKSRQARVPSPNETDEDDDE
ncbi:hypothetical protein JCM3765_007620 [Sporobolomyces pararoseus]